MRGAWQLRTREKAKAIISRLYQPVGESMAAILCYHDIPSISTDDFYAVPASSFEVHLEATRFLEARVISPLGILDGPDNDDLRPYVVLTFDDGFVSFYEEVFPRLKSLGFPFLISITTSLLDNPGRLTKQQLREIASYQGSCIASHGVTHRKLTTLSSAEVFHELRDSKLILEDILGEPVSFLAYPHGDQNASVRAVARRSGYKAALGVLESRTPWPPNDLFNISRLTLTAFDSLQSYVHKIQGNYDWLGAMKWAIRDGRKNKEE